MTPPAGTPWWAWLVAVLAVAVITGAASVLAAVVAARRAIKPTTVSVEAIREQVQNTHSTNLREDLDGMRQALEEVKAEAAAGARSSSEAARRAERFAEDLAISLRALEHSLDRRDKRHGRELDEVRAELVEVRDGLADHINEVPGKVEALLAQHGIECPARSLTDRKDGR